MSVRWDRLSRATALLAVAAITVGAAWSNSSAIPLASGAWSAPGGVSSGLQLWLDASEPSSLFPATQSRLWIDKSGSERDARTTEGSGTLSIGSSGGYAEALFATSTLSLPVAMLPEPMTLAIVVRIPTSSSAYPLIGSRTRGTGIVMNTGKVRFYVNDVYSATGLISPSSGRMILLIRTTSGGADYVNVNGGSDLSASFTSSEPLDLIGGIYLTTSLRTLSAGVSEVAVWSRVLSSAERLAVTRALGSKWGISVP